MPLSREDFFDEEFFAQFPELQQRVQTVAQNLIPVDNLDPVEKRRRMELQQRAGRLSPLEAPAQQSSTRIRGNPYSSDISPVTNALQQGLVNVINATRQRRLMGTEDKPGVLPQLNVLEEKAERAAGQEQSQNEFMQEMFPDLAGKLFDAEKSAATEAERTKRAINVQELRGTQDRELETLRQEGRTELEELRQEFEGTDGEGGNIPASVVTNFANMGRNAGQTLFGQAEAIRERLNDSVSIGRINAQARADGVDPAEVIAELEEEAAKKERIAWQMMGLGARAAEQAGLTPELTREYEALLDNITGNAALDDL